MAKPSCFLLVPVRNLSDPKRRLAAVLSRSQRVDLMRVMLTDVVAAAREAVTAPVIVVVSADPGVLAYAASVAAVPHRVSATTLNGAVAESSVAMREANPAGRILVLPGDVPTVRGATIDAAFAALETAPIVVAQAARDGGTNLLGFQASRPIAPAYGAASFSVHKMRAQAAGLVVHVLEAADLARDIDTPDDLVALAAFDGLASGRFVRSLAGVPNEIKRA